MTKENINYQEEVLKAGLLIGLTSVFITLVAYMISVETMTEWWFSLLTLVITIGLTIYLGISYRSSIGGYISFSESFLKTINPFSKSCKKVSGFFFQVFSTLFL